MTFQFLKYKIKLHFDIIITRRFDRIKGIFSII